MPKTTHGGATNALDPEYWAAIEAESEAKSSLGKLSSVSTPKPVNEPKKNVPSPRKRAQTTARPSRKAPTGSGIAGSTVGLGEAGE